MLLRPDPKNHCFGCGGSNPRGMQLSFEQDEDARHIRAVARLDADYQGGAGFLHGGIIATLLDEVMGKVNRFRGVRAVTAELNVEYLRPVPVDEELTLDGWETEANGRNLFRAGEIRDSSGTLLARGRGRFVDVSTPRPAKVQQS